MKKNRLLALVLALALMLGLASGIGATAEEEQDWLEYSVYLGLSDVATFLENPNDVVTPYIENRFKIRVSEITQGGLSTIPFKERLATYIAANNLPDLLVMGKEAIDYAANTGYYGQGYDDLIKNHMPNMTRWLDEKWWPEYSHNGLVDQIPNLGVNASVEPYASDPYVTPPAPWGLWVREDVLTACGYTFESNASVYARTIDLGEKPVAADFAIEPAVSTPDEFRGLLQQIKDLGWKVGDADVIPFSSIDWSQFHMGCMFDFGHWRINDAGEVDGFLGTDGAKEYYGFLNGLYRDGLIDPDFIVQTSDQLQAKIVSGRVAAGMFAANYPDAQAGLATLTGIAYPMHYIAWPKADESGLGAFDVYVPGFWRNILVSDFEEKERIIEYFDWMYSDEGMDIKSWGPEEAGLWAVDENGQKYFVDEQVDHDVKNGVINGRGSDYYGLYSPTYSYYTYLSKAGSCAPYGGLNTVSVFRTVKPILNPATIGRVVSVGGYDYTSRYSYGNGIDVVAGVNSWYWSKFTGELCAPILSAASDEEFETAWNDMYEEFVYDTNYEEAKASMTQYYKDMGWAVAE